MFNKELRVWFCWRVWGFSRVGVFVFFSFTSPHCRQFPDLLQAHLWPGTNKPTRGARLQSLPPVAPATQRGEISCPQLWVGRFVLAVWVGVPTVPNVSHLQWEMVGILRICKQSPSVQRVGREAVPAPASLESQQGIFFPCPGFPANLCCLACIFDRKLSLCVAGWRFATSYKRSCLDILHCSSSFASAPTSPKLEADGRRASSWRPRSTGHSADGLWLSVKVYKMGVHSFYLKAHLCLRGYFCSTLLWKNHFIGCLILHQSNFKAHWDRGRWCLSLHTDFNKPHGSQC